MLCIPLPLRTLHVLAHPRAHDPSGPSSSLCSFSLKRRGCHLGLLPAARRTAFVSSFSCWLASPVRPSTSSPPLRSSATVHAPVLAATCRSARAAARARVARRSSAVLSTLRAPRRLLARQAAASYALPQQPRRAARRHRRPLPLSLVYLALSVLALAATPRRFPIRSPLPPVCLRLLLSPSRFPLALSRDHAAPAAPARRTYRRRRRSRRALP